MKRTFLKTQMELAKALMEVIDDYYEGIRSEQEAVEKIQSLETKNEDLMYVSGDFGAIIVHRLGKKRMRVLKGAIAQN